MPRPKLNPTEEQRRMVKTMAAMGGKQEEIAMKIGIHSPKTLRKYFRNELDQGNRFADDHRPQRHGTNVHESHFFDAPEANWDAAARECALS